MWGDDEEDRHTDRARRIAAESDHHSVTQELLCGEGRFSATFYLYDEPAVDYLDEGERPAFAFYNEMKGIDVGDGIETYAPGNNGISIVLVTDRRILGLVGRSDGDRRVTLHYDVVTGAEYDVEGLHNRLVVETVEETYHFWINQKFGEHDLGRATEFIHDRMADPGQFLDLGSDADEDEGTGEAAAGEADNDTGITIDEPDGPAFGLGDAADDAAADAADGPSGIAGDGGALDDVAPAVDADGPLEKIRKLHALKETGAISEAEYETKKAELLDQV